MRVLIVSPNPIVRELGASQMAINLAGALRELGVNVVLWELPSYERKSWWLPGFVGWRKDLVQYIGSNGPFDVIDAPAQAITSQLRSHALCVARSVQPQLSYLWANLKHARISNAKDILWFLRNCAAALYEAWMLIGGWSNSHLILCLGSLERDWMIRKFPIWRTKIRYYLNAISNEDRYCLEKIRKSRKPRPYSSGIRFLWIGRWVAHKGVHLLVPFINEWTTNHPLDTFTIAGCGLGPYPEISQNAIPNNRLKIIPYFARAELPAILSFHDVGLFTSTDEGWGLVLNEMLESGMPVYATRAGGVSDLGPVVSQLLRKFPPDTGDLYQEIEMPLDWRNYGQSFSWAAIASRYVEMVHQFATAT